MDPTVGYDKAAGVVENSGAHIISASMAAYAPATDTIVMSSAETFTSVDHYWGTLLHELTRAAGASSRQAGHCPGRLRARKAADFLVQGIDAAEVAA